MLSFFSKKNVDSSAKNKPLVDLKENNKTIKTKSHAGRNIRTRDENSTEKTPLMSRGPLKPRESPRRPKQVDTIDTSYRPGGDHISPNCDSVRDKPSLEVLSLSSSDDLLLSLKDDANIPTHGVRRKPTSSVAQVSSTPKPIAAVPPQR